MHKILSKTSLQLKLDSIRKVRTIHGFWEYSKIFAPVLIHVMFGNVWAINCSLGFLHICLWYDLMVWWYVYMEWLTYERHLAYFQAEPLSKVSGLLISSAKRQYILHSLHKTHPGIEKPKVQEWSTVLARKYGTVC